VTAKLSLMEWWVSESLALLLGEEDRRKKGDGTGTDCTEE